MLNDETTTSTTFSTVYEQEGNMTHLRMFINTEKKETLYEGIV